MDVKSASKNRHYFTIYVTILLREEFSLLEKLNLKDIEFYVHLYKTIYFFKSMTITRGKDCCNILLSSLPWCLRLKILENFSITIYWHHLKFKFEKHRWCTITPAQHHNFLSSNLNIPHHYWMNIKGRLKMKKHGFEPIDKPWLTFLTCCFFYNNKRKMQHMVDFWRISKN